MFRKSFPGWRPFALTAALGALAGLGLAPFHLWPLTLLALAAALRLVPKSPFWLGWALGIGWFASTLNWIVNPFLVEPETYGWMAPFALILMAAGLGAFWSLGLGLGSRLGAPGLVAGLSATEFARGHILTGFPWALPGHVWIDWAPVQVGALVGPFGLTLFTLGLAALASRPRTLPLAVLSLAAAWGYGAHVLSLPMSADKPITLRLVQPSAAQSLKWDPDQAAGFYRRLIEATAAPAGPLGRPDLVIWPETALPYMVENAPDLPREIAAAAGGGAVLTGLQRVERGADSLRGWNALAVWGPGGKTIATYDKHHLVPFGEYIPLGELAYDWFGIKAFAARVGAAYSAGPGPQVLDLGQMGHVLPLICYEAIFPQDLRGVPRPDWLLQITNDGWFGTFSGPFQHEGQARLRAIEQGLPLVRVGNTGVTEVVDARGRVVASLPFGPQGHLDARLPGGLDAPPYARWGEIPFLLLLAGSVLFAILVKRRRMA
ncbi:apolipoprotein N-acyltransferase [Rhodobacter sp. KR11]|uniref:apolipoprotein N-acyltransferase n=1 Tax=Rhodobacter sp. KR11 TaxID=2974588 RepID=UPI0022221175|nr:apolipoprotein N-acyltransferase [Rhodobacter sp. KR11]MCW1918427.1 apolipoprotein N-acyltransferase [Rhodobacter sp. KR11]